MSLTKEIQNIICKAEIQKGNLVAENLKYLFAGELDVASVSKYGYIHEFEVKISRADFKADAKKRKWFLFENPLAGKTRAVCPHYFTYVCPVVKGKAIISETELAHYMGLIYIVDGEIQVVRKPKLIHKLKIDMVKVLTKILTVNNWAHYFGAQKLTILSREAKERNDEAEQKKLATAFSHIHERNNPKHCFLQCNDCKECEIK